MSQIIDDLGVAAEGLAQSAPYEVAILAIALFALMGFIATLFLYLKSQSQAQAKASSTKELTGGLRGRLEKLEMEFNGFRTETIRDNQFKTTELIHIRKQLAEIKSHLNIDSTEETLDIVEDVVSEKKKIIDPEPEVVLEEESKSVYDNEITEKVNEITKKVEEESIDSLALENKIKKTREGFLSKLKSVFKDRNDLDEIALDEVEEILVLADIGVKTSVSLIQESREMLESGKLITKQVLLKSIENKIEKILSVNGQSELPIVPQREDGEPYIVLLLGVNGAGKTTSAAKLAYQWQKQGKKVLMAAADTFRAAAVEQLCNWGKQMDVPVVVGAENAKPATVVFEALDTAQREGNDVVLVDTAGRLHNKANLMQELEGINNVIKKKYNREADEVILVVDGASGQNALSQAREFNSTIPLTGIVVTKLDGTPKGGIVVAIKSELGVPIRYVGLGESKDSLKVFNGKEFAEAIFANSSAA